MQASDAIDRVAVDHLVSDCETEGEAEHGLGAFGSGVRLLAELHAHGDSDHAQGIVAQGRGHEPIRVALVVEPGRRGDPVLQAEVGQPLVDQREEEAIGRQRCVEGPIGGTTSTEKRRIAELEQEVRELRRANSILKSTSAFFAAELDRPHR